MKKRIVIAGASGLVGSAALEHFLNQSWDVIALSRRRPDIESNRPFTHLPLDLDDEKECQTALSKLTDAPFLLYSALYEKSEGLAAGWMAQDQIEKNARMLRHVVSPLLKTAKGHLRAVVIHGTKAYGVHLPPPHITKVPARESDPRIVHPNFYWEQEDFIKETAAENPDFGYTFLRPPLIINGVFGGAMSVLATFGVYAAICKELNRPFGFPGSLARNFSQMVDSRLLAKMMEWALTHESAKNQTFNITNGDVFSWRDLWPTLAHTMGLKVGEDAPCEMKTFLPAQEALWQRIVEKHNLKPLTLKELLSTSDQFADLLWGPGETEPRGIDFASEIKRHKHGFNEVIDSTDAAVYHLKKLLKKQVIPHYS